MFGLSSLLSIFFALRVRGLPMSRMQWWIRPGPRRPCTNKAIFHIWKEYYRYLRTYDLYVMIWMLATPIRGQAGGGWALEVETFLSPVKWHRAVRGPKKYWFPGPNPLLLAQVMDSPALKALHTGTYQSEVVLYTWVSLYCVHYSAFCSVYLVSSMHMISGPTPSNGRGLCIGGGASIDITSGGGDAVQ